MNDEITKDDLENALVSINDTIAGYFTDTNNSLNSIDSNVSDINSNIEEYLILKEPDKIEKIENEKKEETKSETREVEENTSEFTIDDVYSEITQTNSILTEQNNILTVGLFSQGILIGVLVLTLFWNRFMK